LTTDKFCSILYLAPFTLSSLEEKKTIQAIDVTVSKVSGGNLIPHEKYR
jgi:hypothetical protein